jgi:hypothetical protein
VPNRFFDATIRVALGDIRCAFRISQWLCALLCHFNSDNLCLLDDQLYLAIPCIEIANLSFTFLRLKIHAEIWREFRFLHQDAPRSAVATHQAVPSVTTTRRITWQT